MAGSGKASVPSVDVTYSPPDSDDDDLMSAPERERERERERDAVMWCGRFLDTSESGHR